MSEYQHFVRQGEQSRANLQMRSDTRHAQYSSATFGGLLTPEDDQLTLAPNQQAQNPYQQYRQPNTSFLPSAGGSQVPSDARFVVPSNLQSHNLVPQFAGGLQNAPTFQHPRYHQPHYRQPNLSGVQFAGGDQAQFGLSALQQQQATYPVPHPGGPSTHPRATQYRAEPQYLSPAEYSFQHTPDLQLSSSAEAYREYENATRLTQDFSGPSMPPNTQYGHVLGGAAYSSQFSSGFQTPLDARATQALMPSQALDPLFGGELPVLSSGASPMLVHHAATPSAQLVSRAFTEPQIGAPSNTQPLALTQQQQKQKDIYLLGVCTDLVAHEKVRRYQGYTKRAVAPPVSKQIRAILFNSGCYTMMGASYLKDSEQAQIDRRSERYFLYLAALARRGDLMPLNPVRDPDICIETVQDKKEPASLEKKEARKRGRAKLEEVYTMSRVKREDDERFRRWAQPWWIAHWKWAWQEKKCLHSKLFLKQLSEQRRYDEERDLERAAERCGLALVQKGERERKRKRQDWDEDEGHIEQNGLLALPGFSFGGLPAGSVDSNSGAEQSKPKKKGSRRPRNDEETGVNRRNDAGFTPEMQGARAAGARRTPADSGPHAAPGSQRPKKPKQAKPKCAPGEGTNSPPANTFIARDGELEANLAIFLETKGGSVQGSVRGAIDRGSGSGRIETQAEELVVVEGEAGAVQDGANNNEDEIEDQYDNYQDFAALAYFVREYTD